ncbi:tautomerase family protein [Alteribacter aurantiacus]|uniref:tautomerase family protein n=1 Tax=Alteribacter aurantiacus TaxID=254410 RepID=UPI000419DC06|nr:2-hydroxymuconate tautomerase family protein [Alteribacter aurantiacus]
MPIAHIHILEGRTVEQKRNLIKEISVSLSENLEVSKDRVKVLLHEMPDENWGSNGISKGEEKERDQFTRGSA